MNEKARNRIARKASTTPQGEEVGPGLGAHARRAAEHAAVNKRSVMDKLLGENNLAAFDPGGTDPYNATGRHLRR